jgi:hypothetical protein
MKTVLITLFDIKGIVHFEFFPQGQIVNKIYRVERMKQLREAVCGKRPEQGPVIEYPTMTMHQLTGRSGPKIDY